jgi:hypothetical protein
MQSGDIPFRWYEICVVAVAAGVMTYLAEPQPTCAAAPRPVAKAEKYTPHIYSAGAASLEFISAPAPHSAHRSD